MSPEKKLSKMQDELHYSYIELNDFLKNEVFLKDKLLFKRYEKLKASNLTVSPPVEFASLIKDKNKRNKYCLLAIRNLEARLGINSGWERLSSIADMKIYTIISISLIIVAITIRSFGLTSALIIGTIAYWLLNELSESGKKANEFALKCAIPWANKWRDDIKKFKEFIAE
jgi:hypothetical protein